MAFKRNIVLKILCSVIVGWVSPSAFGLACSQQVGNRNNGSLYQASVANASEEKLIVNICTLWHGGCLDESSGDFFVAKAYDVASDASGCRGSLASLIPENDTSYRLVVNDGDTQVDFTFAPSSCH